MVFVIVSFSRKINFISNARERGDVLKWHEVDGDPRINIVELDAFGAHDSYFACFFCLLPQGNRCNCERRDATERDGVGNQANRVRPGEVHAEIIVPGSILHALCEGRELQSTSSRGSAKSKLRLSANSASKKQIHFRRVSFGNSPDRQSSYENDAAAPRSSVFFCPERANAISMYQRLPGEIVTTLQCSDPAPLSTESTRSVPFSCQVAKNMENASSMEHCIDGPLADISWIFARSLHQMQHAVEVAPAKGGLLPILLTGHQPKSHHPLAETWHDRIRQPLLNARPSLPSVLAAFYRATLRVHRRFLCHRPPVELVCRMCRYIQAFLWWSCKTVS